MTLKQVADELNISLSQTYALVRSGDLKAIQVGGRNQWRVERIKLEDYIQDAYHKTSASLAALPYHPDN
jgi:excisionase family DNA binding protein